MKHLTNAKLENLVKKTNAMSDALENLIMYGKQDTIYKSDYESAYKIAYNAYKIAYAECEPNHNALTMNQIDMDGLS